MSDAPTPLQVRLDTLRTRCACTRDAVRIARIEALARRAQGQGGAVRGLLDARIAELIDACATGTGCTGECERRIDAAPPPDAGRAAMAELLRRFDHASAHGGAAGSALPVPGVQPVSTRQAPDHARSPPRRAAFDDVRSASLRARTESQARQALNDAPENAGPLNSANLVHRALNAMRDAAPGYLFPFMTYVDLLACIEAAGLSPAPTASPLPVKLARAASGAKPAKAAKAGAWPRAKARRPRG